MAHFRGTVQGNRGEASRLGHKKDGLRVTCNGWNCGVEVRARHVDGEDVFDVYLTPGSGFGLNKLKLGSYTRAQLVQMAEINGARV